MLAVCAEAHADQGIRVVAFASAKHNEQECPETHLLLAFLGRFLQQLAALIRLVEFLSYRSRNLVPSSELRIMRGSRHESSLFSTL